MTTPSDQTGVGTIDGLLSEVAARWGQRTAVVDGPRRYTYAELHRRCLDAAGGLAALGVAKGDRVAIWMPNRIEWVTSFFGAIGAGAVVVPLNTALSVSEAQYQVAQSGATVLIVGEVFRKRNYLAEALELCSRVEHRVTVVVVGDAGVDGTVSWRQIAVGPHAAQPSEHTADDAAMILYTSGTTGLPKGAVHSHRFTQTLAATADRLALTEEDCVVLYLPLFHVYALVAGLLLMVSVGAKIALMERFRAAESLELMRSEGATMVYGVPTTYIDQLNDAAIADMDFAGIRFAITPMPADLCERVRTRLNTVCLNTFGMTETASTVIMPRLTDPEQVAIGTVGRPLDGIEARVADETTAAPLACGSRGVLWVRGPSVMIGYHDNPVETAKVLDDQGWFRTGDLAELDEHGNIVFIGRSGDHYRVGSELVDPLEVEAVLQAHPVVQRAAALGVPHDRLGQVGYAWVQFRPGATVSPEELQLHAARDLASFKVPRRIIVVTELPTTPSGKVQKFRLRASVDQQGVTSQHN
jgi:acyl-CoA synthetase (AMP-forming)/AMP-acid ligase II